MTTLRNHCTPERLLAHSILDRVRAGENLPAESVNWALVTLGETI